DEHMLPALPPPFRHRRALAERRSPSNRRRGKPADVLHRVKAEGVPGPERAVRGRPAQLSVALEPRPVQELYVHVTEDLAVEPDALRQLGRRVRLVGDEERAVRLGITGDLLLGDQLADRLDRLDPDRDRTAGGLEPPRPDAILERDLAERDEGEAAVAAAGAPADPVRLEHHGVEPVGAREAIGGREPGVAAADHG